MQKQLLTFILILGSLSLAAQELTVKSFTLKENDLSARTNARYDNNEMACALVKVQLAAPGASFTGNVIGDVVFKNNEYWVYMAAGSKRLKVTHPSYLPLEVAFADYEIEQLKEKSTYVLTLLLGDLPQGVQPQRVQTGWILLDSEPQGASVFVNDEFVGNTPLEGYKQPYGTYSYRLEHPNYHPSKGTIELNTGRFEKKITLQPAFGSISVKCNIDGALVVLDGKSTGQKTPCILQEVASGQHTISLQKDKYAPRQASVVVEDGKTSTMNLSLYARFATISITSLDGAQIFCNGKQIGTTKVDEDMMDGYYDIEVKLDHHKTVTKQIQVTAGQPQQITLNPIPIYGSLDITSTPRDADISIDGKTYGKTPFTVEQLLEGEHNVVLSKEGYSLFRKVVSISNEKVEVLSVTMREGYLVDEEKSSITISGIPKEKDWRKIRTICRNKNIKSVDLRDAECTHIPKAAFSNCVSLNSIAIPNSVTSIADEAFSGCINLTSVHITDLIAWCKISFESHESQPLFYANHLYLNGEEITDLVIPEGVVSINKYAFCGCRSLISVTIPNSVTSIGDEAFARCGLTSISIPKRVTTIGKGILAGCCELNSIVVASDNAFYDSRNNCNSIIGKKTNTLIAGCKNSRIPNGITSISGFAFSDCSSLTSIDIPGSVTSIGESAFSGCSSLTSIAIPGSVTRIGDSAFRGCSDLTTAICSGVKVIGNYAFSGCNSLLTINIPSLDISIGKKAFENCNKLTIRNNSGIYLQSPSSRNANYYMPSRGQTTLRDAYNILRGALQR